MEVDYTLSRLSDVIVDNSVRRFDFDTLCGKIRLFLDLRKMHGGKRYEQIEGDPQICG